MFRPAVVQRTLEVSPHPLLMVDGRLQVEHGRVNVLVEQVTALTPDGDRDRHARTRRLTQSGFQRIPRLPLTTSGHAPIASGRRDTSVTLRQQCPDIGGCGCTPT